jgi:hypothetical protein
VKEKGVKYLTQHKIRISHGLVGLTWAEKLLEKGYKIRFLKDFTHIEGQDSLLLAWHPRTADVKLAQIFGVGEFKSSPGMPGYLGEYVNREKSPKAPIRSATIQQYIKDHVKDFYDVDEVGKVVRAFYEKHNNFIAVLTPEQIDFGFPDKKEERQIQETMHSGGMVFLGFRGEGQIPFTRQVSIIAGGFTLSENLSIKLHYDVNLMAFYDLSWLLAKKLFNPGSVNQQQINALVLKTWLSWFHPETDISCRHVDAGDYCTKRGS